MKNDDVVSAVPLAGHYRNRTSPRRVPQRGFGGVTELAKNTSGGMALASRRNDPSPYTGVVAFVALRRSQRAVFGADQPKSPENRSRSPAIAITRDRATHRR